MTRDARHGELVEAVRALIAENESLRAERDALEQELSGISITREPAKRGRATPPEITSEVVRETIVRLGNPSAAEIVADLAEHGMDASGQAVRWLAKAAGIEPVMDRDGVRRYRARRRSR